MSKYINPPSIDSMAHEFLNTGRGGTIGAWRDRFYDNSNRSHEVEVDGLPTWFFEDGSHIQISEGGLFRVYGIPE